MAKDLEKTDGETVEQAGPAPKSEQSQTLSRRNLLAGALAMVIAPQAMAAGENWGPNKDSYAERMYGNYQTPLAKEMLDDQGRPIGPELSPEEIPLKGQALEIMFREYLHQSLWTYLIGRKEEEARRAFSAVFDFPNEFHYSKKGENWVIRKRPGLKKYSYDENIGLIFDKKGLIEVNGLEIDKDMVKDPRDEWAQTEKRAKEVSNVFLAESYYVIKSKKEKMKPADKRKKIKIPRAATHEERVWFGYLSIKLPRALMFLLDKKEKISGLTQKEAEIRDNLVRLLVNHPKTFEEMRTIKPRFIVFLGADSFDKKTGIFRRKKTPQGIYEIVTMEGLEKNETLASFSDEGFLVTPKTVEKTVKGSAVGIKVKEPTGEFERLDSRPNPFDGPPRP